MPPRKKNIKQTKKFRLETIIHEICLGKHP